MSEDRGGATYSFPTNSTEPCLAEAGLPPTTPHRNRSDRRDNRKSLDRKPACRVRKSPMPRSSPPSLSQPSTASTSTRDDRNLTSTSAFHSGNRGLVRITRPPGVLTDVGENVCVLPKAIQGLGSVIVQADVGWAHDTWRNRSGTAGAAAALSPRKGVGLRAAARPVPRSGKTWSW